MNQIDLPLFPPADDGRLHPVAALPAAGPAAGADAIGFEIGWDHAHHRLTPPADHLHGLHPVRQGWEAGRAAFGQRTLQPTRHVRRWLQLRLQAWLEGRPFEGVMLTPRYLAQIDATHCPVTREALTHDSGAPTDAVPMRLQAEAGYAAGHLVTVSRRVVQARGQADAASLLAVARQMAADGRDTLAGLDRAAWERLATLVSLATPMPHAQLACRPLHVLPPNRVRLLNPVQALQALLTQLFVGQAYARRMADVGSLMPDADSRRSYYLFMNAMLARRLAAGWRAERAGLRQALEDAWTHPVIVRRWEQLALRLRRADAERIVRLAVQRGWMDGGRWLDDGAATEGWAAPCEGPRPSRDGAQQALLATDGEAEVSGAAALAASEPVDTVVLRRWRAGQTRAAAVAAAWAA